VLDRRERRCDALRRRRRRDRHGLRLHATADVARHDDGDDVLYVFSADNGVDAPTVVGPQLGNSTDFDLLSGSWTITVSVDDDDCPDVADDATCSTTIEVPCDGPGDTHCDRMDVTGPKDNSPGDYQVSGGGSDDSGNAVLYTFTADNGVDKPMVVETQGAFPNATFTLGEGTWTITLRVDDDPNCDDEADDAVCEATVVVAEPPPPGVGPFIRGDMDGSGVPELTEAVFLFNHLFLGGPEPVPPFPGCGSSDVDSDVALGCETATTNCP
jgi:hypothetical protein